MTTVDFFTPVRFGTYSVYGWADSVLEFADDFCNFGKIQKLDGQTYYTAGIVAEVLRRRSTTGNIPVFETLSPNHLHPFWLKVTVCIATLGIFPLIMLITKAVLRCFYTFEIQHKYSLSDNTPQPTQIEIQQQTEQNAAIRAFHQKAQITDENRFRPLNIDPDNTGLNLDLDEESTVMILKPVQFRHKYQRETIYLGNVAYLVFQQINETLLNKSQNNHEESLPSCRFFHLPIYNGTLGPFAHLGGPFIFTNDDDQKQRWIHRILQALVDAGHLYDFSLDEQGYRIQA